MPIKNIPNEDVRGLILDLIINAPPEIQNGFYDCKKTAKAIRYLPISLAYLIGMRRIGKTELFTWLAIQLYLQYGIKTAWVRNREKEFETNYLCFLNRMRERDLVPVEWIVKRNGVYVGSEKGQDKVIDFVYLNTASNMRGGGHPDTYMMVLDEFQPEDLRYPTAPLRSLMSLTQTILSGKSSMCFCLSNFVSLANPYFVGMEIYPSKQDVTIFPDQGVCIERCRGYKRAIDDDNPWTRIYKTAKYQTYASENEDGLLELVCPPAKGSRAADNVYTCIHGRYYRMFSNGKMRYYCRIKQQPNPSNSVVISPYPEDVDLTVKAVSPKAYAADLQLYLNQKILRFDSPNTLFDLMSPVYYV